MFLLLAAEPPAAPESDEQASSMEKVKVWARKGAETTGPILKKAGSLTLAGAKKAGAASVALTKTVVDGVRKEIAKRRGDATTAEGNVAEAASEEQATEEEASEEEATEK